MQAPAKPCQLSTCGLISSLTNTALSCMLPVGDKRPQTATSCTCIATQQPKHLFAGTPAGAMQLMVHQALQQQQQHMRPHCCTFRHTAACLQADSCTISNTTHPSHPTSASIAQQELEARQMSALLLTGLKLTPAWCSVWVQKEKRGVPDLE